MILNILRVVILYSHLVHCDIDFENVDNDIDEKYQPSEPSNDSHSEEENDVDFNELKRDKNCWMTLNAGDLFNTMQELDNSYSETRNSYQDAVGSDNFDKEMLEVLLQSRGMSDRAIQQAGSPSKIPAGLNLGGYCMMRMKNSMLFFHRLKLRNDTHFHVNYIHNDLLNMVLVGRISLNDLHLVGSYERSITDKDPSVLIYTPNFGQVEFLLKDVQYKMEGRYRLVQERLFIELIISELVISDILMTYSNKTARSPPLQLQQRHIAEFLERLKTDLNNWLRDYFNDYLLNFGLAGSAANAKFRQYDKKKALVLNEYVDSALLLMKQRLQKLNTSAVKLPKISLYATHGVELQLRNGVLYGLDSMYRRSVATTVLRNNVRKVDVIVGFSNLKAVYNYDAILTTGAPPLSGQLILSADELTTHMAIQLLNNPETVDIHFDFFQQMKPESLMLEGPANRMISNFKHLLELHIIAIMTNAMAYQIKLLSSLTKCKPYLVGHVDPHDFKYKNTIKDNFKKDSNEITSGSRHQMLDDSNDKLINNDDDKSNENNSQQNIAVNEYNNSETEDVSNNSKSKEPIPGDQLLQSSKEVLENTDSEADTHNENQTEIEKDGATTNNKDQTNVKPHNVDFILTKDDSIEMELPLNKSHSGKRQKMLINYNEKLTFSKLKSQ